jgi:DNA-binding beta-propeller fold protein YncE
MQIWRSLIYVVSCAALTSAYGCGQSMPPGIAAFSAGPAMQSVKPGQSWIAPDARHSALLYVSDLRNERIDVFSYPLGVPKGKLTGFSAPHGLCSDAAGHVYIVNEGASQILEYAHGGTIPIKTLSDPGYFPSGCSIDPTTGNLAVTNITSMTSAPGSLAIYTHASGTPKLYSGNSTLFFLYYCGYDSSGNLLIDGMNQGAHIVTVAELPAHGTALQPIALNARIAYPGGVQWHINSFAIGDQVSLSGPSKIDEFTISGSRGTEVGTTPLNNSCNVLQFWIQGKRVVVPNTCKHDVLYFNFPAGGSSTKAIAGPSESVGTTVSLR